MSAPDNAKAPPSAPEQQQQQQQQRHQHQHLLHHPNAAAVPPTTVSASSSTVVAPGAASAVLAGSTTGAATVSGTVTAAAAATTTVTAPLTTTTTIEASGGGAPVATANGSNNSDTSGGHSTTDDASSSTKSTSPTGNSGPLPPLGTPAAAGATVGTQQAATVASATSAVKEANPTDVGSGSSSCTPTVVPVVSREGDRPTGTAVSSVTLTSGGGATGGTTSKAGPPVTAATVASTVGGGSNVVAVKSSSGGPGGIGGSGTTSASTAAGPPSSRSGGRSEVAEKQSLEQHCRMLEGELQAVKESETKLKQQYSESQRRERILTRRLLAKDQEVQDYVNQITELKAAQAPGPAALRSALLDPAVNILFQKLKAELQATKAKLEETQNELSAWKFTPDSNTGKRLMAKCRLLYQENEELGKMTSNGRLAKLESELALQKSYNEEVKKSQLELDDFLQELDEDVEGMQGTIVFLQQELKQTKDNRDELEKEVCQLRAYVANLASATSTSDDLSGTGGGTPTEESAMQEAAALLHGGKSNTTYHHPDGGGGRSGDIIGGSGGMGGGVTPIYLVNGGGGSAGNAANNANHGSNRLLVNKSSSVVGGDQDSVYNRTHCGGVSVYSSELRTTTATGLPAAATATAPPAASSSSSSSSATGSTTATSAAAASSEANRSPVNGAATVSDIAVATAGGGPPLLGATNSSGNSNSTSGDSNIATGGNSVHSGSNSGTSASIKLQQQQQQPPPPQQQSQRASSNTNTGRNGGRTVGARKRNYTDTESEHTEHHLSDASSSASAVGGRSGDAFEGSAGAVVPMVVDGVVESVANGKVLVLGTTTDGGGGSQVEQQDDTNSNKRMTRSGKGKVLVPSTPSSMAQQQQPGGPTHAVALGSNSAVSATNVHAASAAKKLRRGSLAIEEETIDTAPITESPATHLAVHPPQQQPQTVTSANGSN
ncbi:mucin-5AC-like [Anopheles aquasalis]|uniref:mucin-5AC-like n=1 Tax=Anopheles aquasalis TaxID=42839 RepID=UPI00215A7913|nr:mucin-5AC-like [Anopheles aquasalis]XP_050092383.1 mucin-5AC-like [Anopheles aquasalis]XP_050092384.1 mucin-5AC-like [Anopheles aquasalis]XP_050092385.1 mucin-5AC-like [Anopheles aquasalis]